ncbi:sec1 family domain-containing protein MIP3 [Phoenix dactylifera]|uniref:Sec1 family domain-containing protein MIP3 n=1 Tax=Phoenix dactylifera TaxID=42345 RepID=A0A8B7BMC1_PHODC|nr:sec1 family domain-containing protein MIP3 [Phoenix dactylifera]
MASVDLIRSCLDSIRQISDQVAEAILYLDAGCLEAFQFVGAFPLLLELGVRAVCSLENMSPPEIIVDWNSTSMDPARKIVIITSHLLSDAHRYILRCLATHRMVLQCTIFTSISEISHSAYVDSPLGPDAFREYESLLLQDYEELVKKTGKKGLHSHQQNEIRQSTKSDHQEKLVSDDDSFSQLASTEGYDTKFEASTARRHICDDDSINCTEAEDGSTRLRVTVDHFPMVLCPISPRVFVLPSEGTVAEACLSNDHEDSLSPGLPSICTGLPSDGEDFPPGATLSAHFLYHLAAKMDLKLEIFSLGDTSKMIGKILTDMSSLYDVGRTKRSAGLLLIDRTLDLLTPCCHGDSFFDRMFASLPRRGRTSASFPAKSSQSSNRLAPTYVQRVPLDIKIPFGTIFSKDEPAMSSTQLSESFGAFAAGWNSGEVGFEADLVDVADKVHANNVDHEFSSLCGSFLSTYTGVNYLEALLDRGAKDGAILIKKWLLEALQHDKIPLNLKGHLNLISELHALVKKLAPNQMSLIQNRGIIQLALAAEIALSEPHGSRWDAFVSAERILTVSSVDTTQSLSSQIRDLINTSILSRSMEASQGVLSFHDALLLSMIGYILAGEHFPTSVSSSPFSWEEEHSLKEAIVDAILEKPSSAKFRFLHGLENELEATSKKGEPVMQEDTLVESPKIDDFDDQWGSWDDEDTDNQHEQAYGDMQLKLELRDRVDQLFKFFHKLASLKWRNPTLKEGLVASNRYGGDPYTRKSLLYKLLVTILAKYDVPGLEYHSSAVGRFFKSGFGRFGLGQAKPSFGDQNVLLIFVVGGINSLEVREAMEAVSENSRPEIELILGGTTLLTPDDMFDLLLGSSSYI